ncbi:hypothetical protein [Mangrovibacter plantisponsor]|uniref:Uncharacterized protein n=1 Tax=Mangrovibacter plantisponsor TaxID=451513 RepID=A0A317PV91_9ENTR|nr:hypothetical protein [Mangrovibacter plantisponsor]PWW04614.1 hypothetical protein DES37_1152 [Mangrovibacter plantisponsor]
MSDAHFAPPLFIQEKNEEDINLALTPWFCNTPNGPVWVAEPAPEIVRVEAAPDNPATAIGTPYVVADIVKVTPNPPWGTETQLGFSAAEVVFEPFWATPAIAAAFGATLIQPGQAIQISSPVSPLQYVEYDYGVFAGHWSPYQGTGNTLLTVSCTDLEHHDFPHVFASTDPLQPLVVSVGRYWPEQSIIRVADLWVKQGDALYIPPKPALPNQVCLDLHNNRNSALACWGNIQQNSITTHTLLQQNNGYFYWYWNALATVHSRPVMPG